MTTKKLSQFGAPRLSLGHDAAQAMGRRTKKLDRKERRAKDAKRSWRKEWE